MDGEILRNTIPVRYAIGTVTIASPQCGATRTATTASRPLDTKVSTTAGRRPHTTRVTIPDTAARTARHPTTITITISRPTATTVTARDTAALTIPLTTTGHTAECHRSRRCFNNSSARKNSRRRV